MSTILQLSLSETDGPKYRRVAKAILREIDSGALAVGDQLPPVRDLAWSLQITPGTVARAYKMLTDDGHLLAEIGRGTFVASPMTNLQADVWAKQTSIPKVWEAQSEPPETHDVSLFSPRLPDVGQVAALQSALRQVAELGPDRLLNYPMRVAYAPLREVIVDWLSDVPLGGLSPDDVVLSHGGQNAICLCLQSILHGARPVILVEDLSYAGFRRAAEILRADVAGVQMDAEGPVPEALEAAIRRTGAQVFCTSPEVQNPTGLHTPIARRVEIARICERHNVHIIEDDCYRVAEAQADSYRKLAPGIAWYVSSFSKSFTPALRVGFAVAPKGRGADLRRVAEYGFFGLAQPLAELTRIILSDPETKVLIEKIQARMAEYVQVAVNTLGAFDVTWSRDVSFVWLVLPPGWRAAAFCRAAEAEGVQIRSADEFALRDGRAPHAVRIAMNCHVGLTSFEAAMQRLLHLLHNPPEQISV